jgi:hypothetical protein
VEVVKEGVMTRGMGDTVLSSVVGVTELIVPCTVEGEELA